MTEANRAADPRASVAADPAKVAVSDLAAAPSTSKRRAGVDLHRAPAGEGLGQVERPARRLDQAAVADRHADQGLAGAGGADQGPAAHDRQLPRPVHNRRGPQRPRPAQGQGLARQGQGGRGLADRAGQGQRRVHGHHRPARQRHGPRRQARPGRQQVRPAREVDLLAAQRAPEHIARGRKRQRPAGCGHRAAVHEHRRHGAEAGEKRSGRAGERAAGKLRAAQLQDTHVGYGVGGAEITITQDFQRARGSRS